MVPTTTAAHRVLAARKRDGLARVDQCGVCDRVRRRAGRAGDAAQATEQVERGRSPVSTARAFASMVAIVSPGATRSPSVFATVNRAVGQASKARARGRCRRRRPVARRTPRWRVGRHDRIGRQIAAVRQIFEESGPDDRFDQETAQFKHGSIRFSHTSDGRVMDRSRGSRYGNACRDSPRARARIRRPTCRRG